MTWTLTWTLVPLRENLLGLVVSSGLFLEGSAVDIVGIHCKNARELLGCYVVLRASM